jgi:hypothetical protein
MIPFFLAILLAATVLALLVLRSRGLHRCVLPYLLQSPRRRTVRHSEPVHLLFCIADHFEPQSNHASPAIAQQRTQAWVDKYPELFGNFRDSIGRSPRHTFFFPIDQYDDRQVSALSTLCRRGFAELEIHLHHDRDNPDNLRRTLEHYKLLLSERHGLLSRNRATGDISYGFVHGNWALANSRPDGRHCGVNSELDILRQAGCYADFTLPSAPSPTQTRMINSIYYTKNQDNRPRSHDSGIPAGKLSSPPSDSLLLIQGPLLLDWRHRRIENGCLQVSQPPSEHRLDLWLSARIHVPQRPDWLFVKLHTHGATERNQQMLLGQAMLNFHHVLQKRTDDNPNFNFHYVTAREMYNLVRAAESGYSGAIADALDYELVSNCSTQSKAAAI